LTRGARRRFSFPGDARGLVFELGAVPAPGELKPWSGGATPPLALRDLQGKEHKRRYRGKAWVLISGHLVRSLPREMPSMQRLQDKLAGILAILAIDYGEGARGSRTPEESPVRFTVWLDRDTSTATGEVKVLPTPWCSIPISDPLLVVASGMDFNR